MDSDSYNLLKWEGAREQANQKKYFFSLLTQLRYQICNEMAPVTGAEVENMDVVNEEESSNGLDNKEVEPSSSVKMMTLKRFLVSSSMNMIIIVRVFNPWF